MNPNIDDHYDDDERPARSFRRDPDDQPTREDLLKERSDNLKEWRLGKRIAEALRLTPVNGDKYRTEWGEKNPIALTKALRAILK